MAKKTTKQPPHLRIRIDPKLIARLEKAREGNSNTLTGEIVARLEESFATQDKIALFRAATENEQKRLNERVEQLSSLLEERSQREDEAEMLKAETAVIDALIGDDVATREAVRNVAILLASNPDWTSTSSSIQKLTLAAVAAITAAAAKGVQK